MSDKTIPPAERIQELMTSLLEHHLADSLEQVRCALERWHREEIGALAAHAELLRHAARSERLADRMARSGAENADSLVRDAFDAKLIDREEFQSLLGKPPEEVQPAGADPDAAGGPSKRGIAEELLGNGPILVHVDASASSVLVPERFRDEKRLVLRFGYDLKPAIIDLCIDDDEIAGTLTFSGVPHRCVLPWTAVYALVSESDNKGMVWPEDIPDSVVGSFAENMEDPATGSSSSSASGSPASKTSASNSADKPGGHLTLVK